MNAYFFSFSKNPDSTARPVLTSGTQRTIVFKDPTSIIDPVVSLRRDMVSVSWNYMYIPDLGRYYFIDDIVFNGALAEVHCNVDMLASWKTQIGSSTQYVVRAASDFDGDVIDELYPITGGITSVVDSDGGYPTVENGTFVLGIISNDAIAGSVAYYGITAQNLSRLCATIMNYVINDPNFQQDTWISKAFQNSIIDPLSKIVSACWFPISYSDFPGNATTSIHITDWEIFFAFAKQLTAGPLAAGGIIEKTFDLTPHPMAADRGNYLNLEPYTKTEIIWQPFGVIPIDTSLIYGATSITCSMRWDWATGEGYLEARATKSDGTIQAVFNVQGQVGVPIQLSSRQFDVFTGVASGVGLAGSLAAGNAVGTVLGIGNLTNSMKPRTASVGQMGNFISYTASATTYPRLIQRFFTPADDDPTRKGRPLMQPRVINTLSGFIQCDHVDLDLPATSRETDRIKALMEGGFFYE